LFRDEQRGNFGVRAVHGKKEIYVPGALLRTELLAAKRTDLFK